MSSTAVFEHAYYVGNFMSGIIYGVDLVLYYLTLQSLYHRRDARQSDKFFAIYSTILLVLLTVDTSVNAVWGEEMWITFRDNPGGPSTFIVEHLNIWYQILGSCSVVAMIFAADALLLWRCYIIWNSTLLVIALPIIIYVAAFIMGILELVAAFSPGGFFFAGKSVVFGTAYYSLAIALNLSVTLLICGRLLYLSRAVRSTLGEQDAKLYTSVVTIMVESAAPYTILGIVFLVPYARSSQTAVSFGQVWAKLAVVCPQLIILRVTRGIAWGKNTMKEPVSSMFFQNKTRKAESGTISFPITSLSVEYDSAQMSGTRIGEQSRNWSSDQEKSEV